MATLFDIEAYNTPIAPQVDPYWDEIVLTKTGAVDTNGQVTLFYDSSDEPPDPDDYPTLDRYLDAWNQWRSSYPHLLDDAKICESKYKSVGGIATDKTKHLSTGRSLESSMSENVSINSTHQHVHWLETYWVQRGNKKHYYYRYGYKHCGRSHRCYIGPVRNPKAIEITKRVKQAIAQGENPCAIQRLIGCSKLVPG